MRAPPVVPCVVGLSMTQGRPPRLRTGRKWAPPSRATRTTGASTFVSLVAAKVRGRVAVLACPTAAQALANPRQPKARKPHCSPSYSPSPRESRGSPSPRESHGSPSPREFHGSPALGQGRSKRVPEELPRHFGLCIGPGTLQVGPWEPLGSRQVARQLMGRPGLTRSRVYVPTLSQPRPGPLTPHNPPKHPTWRRQSSKCSSRS
jgi:hypothetical protein